MNDEINKTLENIQKAINVILLANRASIDTSKYIKTPDNKYLSNNAWQNITDAREKYLETIENEINKLLEENV